MVMREVMVAKLVKAAQAGIRMISELFRATVSEMVSYRIKTR